MSDAYLRAMSGAGASQAMKTGARPAAGGAGNAASAGAGAGPNFAQQNRQRIKAMQSIVKARDVERDNAAHAQQFKMNRFTDVPSRVYGGNSAADVAASASSQQQQARAAAPHRAPPAAAGGNKATVSAPGSRPTPASHKYQNTKAALPSQAELAQQQALLAEQHARAQPNFVARNALDAVQSSQFNSQNYQTGSVKPARAPPGGGAQLHGDFGRVPAYLQHRQAEAAAAEEARREAAQAAAEAARGMKLMPEAERVATLTALQERLRAAEQALSAFPLVVETESRKRRKQELEAQVKQLEGMVQALSHEKVYVKV